MDEQFLKFLYDTTEKGFLTLWTRQDKKTYWFPAPEMDAALEKAYALSKEKKDVYFGVGLRKEELKPYAKDGKTVIPRGTAKDILGIPGLWMDIDVAGDAHAQPDLPPSTKAAIRFLEEFPLKPTFLIDSGHGLHGYWLFKEFWAFEDNEEQGSGQELLRRFQYTLKEHASKKGWKLDTTSDLARVLRVPGTMNFKGDPVPVALLDNNSNRYDPEDFEEYLLEVQAAPPPAERPAAGATGPADLIINNCAFIKYCQAHADRISEPEWYAMITNIARAESGPESCHALSKSYARYNPAETDKKIKHALSEGHPHTCQYIQTELSFKECPEQGCNVAAPIGLVSSPVVQARLIVDTIPQKMKLDPASIYGEETIGALAILRQSYPAEYAVAKQLIKELGGKHINLNEFEKVVKHQQVKNSRLRLVQGAGDNDSMGELPEGLLYTPRKPPGWLIDQRGVYFQGEKGPVVASPVPIIITKRLRHVDSGTEKIELAFHRDKRWRYVVANRSTVFTRTRLPELADKGLPVSSESAKNLITFLSELECVNIADIPLVRAISRLGWINSREFLPGHTDVTLDVDGGTLHYANAFKPTGTLQAWVDFISPLRKYPLARLVLAAGFAAPLLEVLNQRIFLLHLWGGSRGGKSAACKAALSLWGNPEEAQVTFNGTRVGLEQQAAFLCNLPMVIDEKQVLSGNRQDYLESLVYMLGMGKGKARGAKGGGLQEFKTWKTLIITNGEHPLTTNSSATGLKTRALEIYARQAIPNEKYSQMIHSRLSVIHGTAGPEFIKRLIEFEGNIQDEYEALVVKLQEWAPELIGSHFGALAVLGLADYLSSIWIFGLSEDEALAETLSLYDQVIKTLETASEAEEAYRALGYLRSWVAQHDSKFREGDRERYGWIEKDILDTEEKEIVYFLPTAFSKAMADGGFNERRIIQDFAENDWIETATEGGKRRYTIKRKFEMGVKRVIVLLPVLMDIVAEEGG